jgi:hypothetical protein
MINFTDLKQLENWGYSLLPAPHKDSPGFSGVEIVMQDTPDPNAFLSPVSLHLHTRDADGHAYWETLHADNKWIPFHYICPGKFHIRDNEGNETTFFSFGASIELEEQDEETVLTICSAAPVLELTPNKQTTANELAEEVEALLARLEARWLVKQNGHKNFFEYLAQTYSPLELYITSIHTLLTHFKEVAALRQINPKLCHLLKTEKAYAQKNSQWPENPLNLDDLFVSSEKM